MARKYSYLEVCNALGNIDTYDLVHRTLLGLYQHRMDELRCEICESLSVSTKKRLLDSTAIVIDGVLYYLADHTLEVEASAITFVPK